MVQKKSTKRALLCSVLSLLLCFSMLLGTTFAWFTDSVTSANNVITAGNLDIKLEYAIFNADGSFKEWKDVSGAADVLTNTLWEPGATEVAYLKIANAGSLALKYQLGVNIVSELAGTNTEGATFLLSDYIKFGVVEGINGETAAYSKDAAGRDAAIAAITDAKKISAGYTKADSMESGDELYLALVVYMPTSVDNTANHKAGTTPPTIELGINIFATQYTFEGDSFGKDYDFDAPIVTAPVARPDTAVTLKGAEGVSIALPKEVIDELPVGVTEIGLSVSAPKVDTAANTITFDTVELIDQDGNVIDLEAIAPSERIAVTLPAQTQFAEGDTVMIYHDGEYAATAVVGKDGVISYDVAHLCEITVCATVAPEIPDGDGVIEIGTLAELLGFADSVNKGNTYKGKTVALTDDIDLNNVKWTPIGKPDSSSTDFDTSFKGTFDGRGHTIKNLNAAGEGWIGVFGLAYGATIKNLTVDGATLFANRMVGAIVGQLYGSIENCHVANATIVAVPNQVGENEYDNGDKVGGIVGWLGDNGNNRILADCSAKTVTIKAYRDMGGIAGYVASSTTVRNNSADGISLTIDQATNYYGDKATNAGAIYGRPNGTITVEGNKEANITKTYVVGSGAQAQAALDSAEDGTTIELVPGVDYGTLYLRPVAGQENTVTDCDYLVYRNEMLRKVENLTIVGAPGATVDAIVTEAGYVKDSGSTGYVVDIKNLVVDSVEFNDTHTNAPHTYAAPFFFDLSYINVNGLTVKNCKLIGNNDKMNFVYFYGSGNPDNSTFETAAKNITVIGNTVDGIARLCELRQAENVTITNNIIKNTAQHGVLLAVDGGAYSGNVTIADNTAYGINERFVRMAGAGDATVVIKDNAVVDYMGEDEDYIKVSDSTGTLTVENNPMNRAYIVSDTEEAQAALDKVKANTTIYLVPGVDYGTLYLGRPTKSNDTEMTCTTHDFSTKDVDAFLAHLAEAGYHTTPRYTTTLKDLTVVGAEGATVAGLLTTSGHAYGDVYDYVRDIDYEVGSAYYNTLHLENVVFSHVNFTGKVDINTSDAETVYDGITFDSCTFTTGGTASANGAAIRYYNEMNNGNVKNIVVRNCDFYNCYQGVYVHHVNGVTVTESTFDTTGHNAIALQSTDEPVALKAVTITENTFCGIGDRIIRFGAIGADSNLTIRGNTATNSGDEDGEVMKAVSIEEGISTAISGNAWGGVVANEELKDA